MDADYSGGTLCEKCRHKTMSSRAYSSISWQTHRLLTLRKTPSQSTHVCKAVHSCSSYKHAVPLALQNGMKRRAALQQNTWRDRH